MILKLYLNSDYEEEMPVNQIAKDLNISKATLYSS